MEWRTDKNCKSILGAIVLFCIFFKFISTGDAIYPYMASIAYPALFIALGFCRRAPKSFATYGKRILRNIICVLIPAVIGIFVYTFIGMNVDTADSYGTLAGKAFQSLYTCVDVSVDAKVQGAGIFGILIALFIAYAIYDLINWAVSYQRKNIFTAVIEFILYGIIFVAGLYMVANHMILPLNPAVILLAAAFMYYGKLLRYIFEALNEKAIIILSAVTIPVFYFEWVGIINAGSILNLSTLVLPTLIGGVLSAVLGSTMLFLLSSLLARIKPIQKLLAYTGDQYVMLLMVSVMNFLLFHKYFPNWPYVVLVISTIYTYSTVEMIHVIGYKIINKEYPVSKVQTEKYKKIVDIFRYIFFAGCMLSLLITTSHLVDVIPNFFYYHGIVESSCCGLCLLIFVFDNRMSEKSLKRIILYLLMYVSALFYMSCAGYILVEWYVFAVFSMMISMTDLSFYKVVLISFIETVVVIAASMSLSMLGVIPFEIMMVVKHLYGFYSPNIFSVLLLMSMVYYLYLRAYGKHINSKLLLVLDVFIYGVGYSILWKEAKGRASEIASIVLTIEIVYWEIKTLFHINYSIKLKKIANFLLFSLSSVFIILLIVSIIKAVIYDPNTPDEITKLIGEMTDPSTYEMRFQMGQIVIMYKSPSVFGHFFTEGITGVVFTVDNAYIRYLYRYGISLTLIYFTIITNTMFKLWKKEKYLTMTMFLVFALVSVMESVLGNIGLCILPLMSYSNEMASQNRYISK